MEYKFRGTTVLCIKHKGKVVIGADGQVSLQSTVFKHNAKKVRRLYQNKVLAGFAGSTSDAFSLFQRFEAKLEEFRGNLRRASVELAQEWRGDKVLRHLEALLVVSDRESAFLISGQGDVIEPDDGLIAIGSGGAYALAAARALIRWTDKSAAEIAAEALRIAGEICVYTNAEITIESL